MLSQQLSRLDNQAAQRNQNAVYLNKALAKIEGITPQARDPRCTCHGHYAYIFHYDKAAFANVPTECFIEALNAEGFPAQASYPPLHELAVFQSGEYRKRLCPEQRGQAPAFLQANFPTALTVDAAFGHRAAIRFEGNMRYIGSALQDNQAEEMLAAIHHVGVDIRPEAMGLTWDDVAEAMRKLAWYVEKAGLWYTIASDKSITEDFIEYTRKRIYDNFGL